MGNPYEDEFGFTPEDITYVFVPKRADVSTNAQQEKQDEDQKDSQEDSGQGEEQNDQAEEQGDNPQEKKPDSQQPGVNNKKPDKTLRNDDGTIKRDKNAQLKAPRKEIQPKAPPSSPVPNSAPSVKNAKDVGKNAANTAKEAAKKKSEEAVKKKVAQKATQAGAQAGAKAGGKGIGGLLKTQLNPYVLIAEAIIILIIMIIIYCVAFLRVIGSTEACRPDLAANYGSYVVSYSDDPAVNASEIAMFLLNTPVTKNDELPFNADQIAGILSNIHAESSMKPERMEAEYGNTKVSVVDAKKWSVGRQVHTKNPGPPESVGPHTYSHPCYDIYKDNDPYPYDKDNVKDTDPEDATHTTEGQPSKCNGIGYFQWTAGRTDKFLDYAEQGNTDWWDPNTQLNFFLQELDEGQYLENMKKMGWDTCKAEDCAKIFYSAFEMGSDKLVDNMFTKSHTKNAKTYFDMVDDLQATMMTSTSCTRDGEDTNDIAKFAASIAKDYMSKYTKRQAGYTTAWCRDETDTVFKAATKKAAEWSGIPDAGMGLGCDCCMFVSVVLRATHSVPKDFPVASCGQGLRPYMLSHPEVFERYSNFSERRPGDVWIRPGHGTLYYGETSNQNSNTGVWTIQASLREEMAQWKFNAQRAATGANAAKGLCAEDAWNPANGYDCFHVKGYNGGGLS